MRPTETVTLHFDLSHLGHLPADQEFTLKALGQRTTLRRHDANTLREHSQRNLALAALPEDQLQRLTHFVEDVELPADAVGFHWVGYASTRPGAVSDEIAVVFQHVPAEAVRRAVRAMRRDGDLAPAGRAGPLRGDSARHLGRRRTAPHRRVEHHQLHPDGAHDDHAAPRDRDVRTRPPLPHRPATRRPPADVHTVVAIPLDPPARGRRPVVREHLRDGPRRQRDVTGPRPEGQGQPARGLADDNRKWKTSQRHPPAQAGGRPRQRAQADRTSGGDRRQAATLAQRPAVVHPARPDAAAAYAGSTEPCPGPASCRRWRAGSGPMDNCQQDLALRPGPARELRCLRSWPPAP